MIIRLNHRFGIVTGSKHSYMTLLLNPTLNLVKNLSDDLKLTHRVCVSTVELRAHTNTRMHICEQAGVLISVQHNLSFALQDLRKDDLDLTGA